MLQPWQLIKLKAQYGGVYVTKYEGKLYVQRQPTLLEVSQQRDQQRVFDLDSEQLFIELTKQCMVYPENPNDVPEEQFEQLVNQMIDDIPLTEEEIENQLGKYQNLQNNIYKQIAVELWQKITGTTVHEFYNRPIGEVLEMYQAQKIIEKLVNEQAQASEQQAQQRIPVSIYNEPQYDSQQYGVGQHQQQPTQSNINELQQFTEQIMGKNITEVLDQMIKKGEI